MPADLEKLAYDSALRALDKQERLVEELRARTGIVLAASSVAISLLGGRALQAPGSDFLGTLAIAGFIVSTGAAIAVLLPRRSLVFAIGGFWLWGNASDAESPLHAMTAQLNGYWQANDVALRRLIRAFSVAVLALGAEVLALAVILIDTIL